MMYNYSYKNVNTGEIKTFKVKKHVDAFNAIFPKGDKDQETRQTWFLFQVEDVEEEE